ncbi:ABC transporter permease [Bacillus aquiflavi]|nr:ABC transporter permease subunit [Bacillus aquiflavi]
MIPCNHVEEERTIQLFRKKRIFASIGFILIFLFFILPILRLIVLSFLQEESITFLHYTEVLQEKTTWTTIKNTLFIVFGATFVSLFLGVGLAWMVAYLNLSGKKWMQLFIFLPFIIPSYITTLAWIQFFSKNGPALALLSLLPGNFDVPNLYSMGGIIFILGLSHYPLVYLFSVNVLQKIPRELEDAAKIAGAKKRKVLGKIVLPLALPGIASGGLLAFLTNLDNFGIPAFLGIPANIRVLSTYIYEQVVGFGPAAFSKSRCAFRHTRSHRFDRDIYSMAAVKTQPDSGNSEKRC